MTVEPKLPFEGVAIDKPTPRTPSPVTLAIHLVENAFLLVIALFTVVAMGQEVMKVVKGQLVQLQDLLLMFIYVEVLGMVAVYYDSKKIPITLPLFIAITALARLVILQGKEQPPVNLIYEGGAILLLAVACVILTWRQNGESRS